MENKIELFLRAKFFYYVVGRPIMSDSEFDLLEKDLRKSNDKLALIVVDLTDFPSVEELEELGLNVDNIAPSEMVKRDEIKYSHLTKMLSIQKVQCNDEQNLPYHDIKLFMNRMPSDFYEASLKFDGNSMDLIYKDGKLFQALTRGDGKVGLDKTHKIKLIVPNNIPILGTIEVRGEIVIDKKLFRKKYADSNKIENERNVVAGFISKEEVDIKVINDLTFVAYSLVSINNDKMEYVENSMEKLYEIGFNKKYKPVVEFMKGIVDFDTVYKNFKKYKEECPFLIDGFVLKFPEKLRAKMGDNNHYWKWCLACKFKSEEASTRINDIIWTVSKEGEYCPIAILEPVILLDTVVTRASLSNLGNIINNGLYPGSNVSLKKSGDIIPYITAVLEKSPNHDEYEKYVADFMKSCSNI